MADVLTPEQIQTNERFSAHLRADIEEEAERDMSEVWVSICSFVLNINHRYTCFTRPIIEFEWNLHDLWYIVIISASATPSNEAGQERLVAEILCAMETGLLSRTTTGTFEQCITSGGRIWTDLPYFVDDLR
jgi:hypothetical protein